ncbi:polysaccharide biosynthesis/export family protein [Sphingomonas sp. LY29]|uniref:polysaccharide biosynthesis/export family protein n=1 Tax=Sphingomonas sp. LY29 TaxID=3095341 RepID=UPI002D7847BA|nr:polysaccharide biosynthesis/export family protein [Sphingomonas sp. LY29]WRP26345.1 polysaccharide biosynthesis/export family protein [Sphingomonas sp. LY29]
MYRSRLCLLLLVFSLSACAGKNVGPGLARGDAAYQSIVAAPVDQSVRDYRIGPLDTIDVAVFQEPELTLKAVQIDAAGNLAFPLIGTVPASGRTAAELSEEIARRLGERYLVDPQVTVVVAGSVSQKVVVQGQVTEPGVYEIKGPTTLLEALSMAKGETRTAALKEVVVFRIVNGQRMGGVFDVASIRRGEAGDPALLGNDVVVVGYSNTKGLWRDVLAAAPLLNVFRPLAP